MNVVRLACGPDALLGWATRALRKRPRCEIHLIVGRNLDAQIAEVGAAGEEPLAGGWNRGSDRSTCRPRASRPASCRATCALLVADQLQPADHHAIDVGRLDSDSGK